MQNYKKMRLAVITLLVVTLLAGSLPQANAAAGTTGTVEYSSNTYLSSSLVSIHCETLTLSGDYTLSFTAGGPSNITFTTSATQTTFDITLVLAAPTSGSMMQVDLVGGHSAAAAAIDSATIIAQDIDDLLPQDLMIDVGIAVMVILIIVGIVVGLAIVGKRRLG